VFNEGDRELEVMSLVGVRDFVVPQAAHDNAGCDANISANRLMSASVISAHRPATRSGRDQEIAGKSVGFVFADVVIGTTSPASSCSDRAVAAAGHT
jgi:hypothetical protein